MNGKTKFWSGIIVGACIGGLVSLLNKDAREYGREIVDQTGNRLSLYTENPDETIVKLKQTVLKLNDAINNNTGSAISALDQVEKTVQRFLK